MIRVLLVTMLLASIAGCATAPYGGSSPPRSPSATDAASAAPPAPSATRGLASTAAEESAGGETDSPPQVSPPVAFLVSDGTQHPGEIGSFSFRGYGADTPWLPADALERIAVPAAGAQLRLAGASATTWLVSLSPESDGEGVRRRGVIEREAAPPTDRLRLPPLPVGGWVLQLHAVYANDEGSGVYYWYVEVR